MSNKHHNTDWHIRRLAEIAKYPLDLSVPDPFLEGIAYELLDTCRTSTVIVTFYGNTDSLVKAWAGEKFEPQGRALFCDLVLHRGGYIEIEDTLAHPLFKFNPDVLGLPSVRFFSSTPLTNKNGFVLGSLCALNKKPMRFTKEQRDRITSLSSRVLEFLENKLTE